jgi:hypothetical protein
VREVFLEVLDGQAGAGQRGFELCVLIGSAEPVASLDSGLARC